MNDFELTVPDLLCNMSVQHLCHIVITIHQNENLYSMNMFTELRHLLEFQTCRSFKIFEIEKIIGSI